MILCCCYWHQSTLLYLRHGLINCTVPGQQLSCSRVLTRENRDHGRVDGGEKISTGSRMRSIQRHATAQWHGPLTHVHQTMTKKYYLTILMRNNGSVRSRMKGTENWRCTYDLIFLEEDEAGNKFDRYDVPWQNVRLSRPPAELLGDYGENSDAEMMERNNPAWLGLFACGLH